MKNDSGFARLAVAGLAVVVALGVQAAGSLSDAKAKIGAAIADAATMTKTMKGLTAADQPAYVGAVNAAIAKLPGSATARSEKFVTANQAMLQGADKKTLPTVIAVVFATAPVSELPVLSKNIAVNMLNRSESKVSDGQFVKIASDVMKEVGVRTAKADSPAVRSAFAVVMFVQASEGKPADLTATLCKFLPADAQSIALRDWVPPAVKGNYEPLLAAADIVDLNKTDLVVRAPSPDLLNNLLAELNNDVLVVPVVNNPTQNVEPMKGVNNEVPVQTEPIKEAEQRDEPGGYQGQF